MPGNNFSVSRQTFSRKEGVVHGKQTETDEQHHTFQPWTQRHKSVSGHIMAQHPVRTGLSGTVPGTNNKMRCNDTCPADSYKACLGKMHHKNSPVKKSTEPVPGSVFIF